MSKTAIYRSLAPVGVQTAVIQAQYGHKAPGYAARCGLLITAHMFGFNAWIWGEFGKLVHAGGAPVGGAKGAIMYP